MGYCFLKFINMKESSPDIFLPLKIAALLLGAMLLVLAFLERLGIRLPAFKVTKQKMASYYKINTRTLTRWLHCFLEEELNAEVHHKRKIPLDTAFKIYKQLGNPDDFPVLNRKTIIDIGEGTYNQLVITINRIAEDYNLPKDKLAKMRTFPPVYGKIITEQFGVHPSEIENYLRKQ